MARSGLTVLVLLVNAPRCILAESSDSGDISSRRRDAESLRVIEQLRRRDFGRMDFEMTIDDPKVRCASNWQPSIERRDAACVPATESSGWCSHEVGKTGARR